MMIDHEQTLYELTEKACEIDTIMQKLSFRLKRTRKNIKGCTETCESTNNIIGEFNVRNKLQ
ncbi:MAG: hypothetical protein WC942_06510 [Clostridia bacterium]|jgi:hypothetical protein